MWDGDSKAKKGGFGTDLAVTVESLFAPAWSRVASDQHSMNRTINFTMYRGQKAVISAMNSGAPYWACLDWSTNDDSDWLAAAHLDRTATVSLTFLSEKTK